MATFNEYAALYGVPSANNASLNPEPDPAFNIMVTSYHPDQLEPDGTLSATTLAGEPTGDLFLDDGALDGEYDSNTLISLDGGVTWQQFDVLFYGYVAPNNYNLYDKTAQGGPDFNQHELVAVRLEDGTELFFFPGEEFTLAILDLFPTGGVPITTTDGPPPVCFVIGTLLTTEAENIAVEDLKVGDTVMTRDNGLQTISWIGKRTMSRNTPHHLMPIRIEAGAFGNNMPKRDLLVSPQHRLLVSDWRAEILFGAPEVLVAARHLVNDTDIRPAADLGTFAYFHILFESHQTVFAEGLPTESFHPGDMALRSISEPARREVLELFPELADDLSSYGPSTHRSLKSFEAKALQTA